MESIIETIIDEISFLLSTGHLEGDIYLDELTAHFFEYSARK